MRNLVAELEPCFVTCTLCSSNPEVTDYSGNLYYHRYSLLPFCSVEHEEKYHWLMQFKASFAKEKPEVTLSKLGKDELGYKDDLLVQRQLLTGIYVKREDEMLVKHDHRLNDVFINRAKIIDLRLALQHLVMFSGVERQK
jgi:hypothetical protein